MSPPVPVLVVDDQRPFRLAAAAVLRAAPRFALAGEAEDGARAVEQVGLLRPDLVLMDVRMPVMDGLEATRLIAASWPQTLVVLCSTYDQEDLPERALESGAAAYVHKEELRPSTLEQLWSRITPPAAAAPG